MLQEINSLVDRFPLAGVLLLLVLGALGLPFPEDMTLILCGFLIANGVLDPELTLLLVYVLLVSIDLFVFWAGRKYGPEIVRHKRLGRLISAERLDQLEEKFKKWGVLLIILARHIVVLRTQIVIAAGVFKMSRYKFLAADAVTIPITMLIMVGIGYAGASSLEIVKKDVSRIENLVVLFIIALVVVYLMLRSVRYRK